MCTTDDTRHRMERAARKKSAPSALRHLSSDIWPLSFDAHGDTHATADAQSGEPFFRVPLLHLVEQCHQHARSRRADRMADRDCPAVDIHLVSIPAEVLIDGAGLRRERLIGLDQIEVTNVPAGLLERRARRRNGSRAHDFGIDAGLSPRHDTRERRLAELGRFAGFHQHYRSGAIIDARGIAGGDGAFFVEGGTQLADRVERGAVLGIFVGIDDDIAFAGLHRHRRDLVLEPARLLRRFGLVLRADRERILLLARDLPLPASHKPSLIIVSIISKLPILTPLRRWAQCGATLMDSWPPATTISESPLTMPW